MVTAQGVDECCGYRYTYHYGGVVLCVQRWQHFRNYCVPADHRGWRWVETVRDRVPGSTYYRDGDVVWVKVWVKLRPCK